MTTDRLILAKRLRGCVNRHEHESEAADRIEKADALADAVERGHLLGLMGRNVGAHSLGHSGTYDECALDACHAAAAYRLASKEGGA